jgi:hypothetical protein
MTLTGEPGGPVEPATDDVTTGAGADDEGRIVGRP